MAWLLASPTRLIGRAPELAELEAALAEAAEGRPTIAFVAGESGVGKTRLVTELADARASEDDGRVLCGDCVELGEGELPYAPLVAALRPLVARQGPACWTSCRPARAELATLLPELGPGAGAPARAEDGEGTAQRRLFEALLSLIERLGREHAGAADCSRTSTGPTARRARSWPSWPAR